MLSNEKGDINGKRNGLNLYAAEEGVAYGWLFFRPPYLKRLLSPLMCRIVLTMCVSYAVMIQHMLPAVQFTLKQRFHLSDKDINGLNIAQGVSLVIAVIIFGFFGNFRAKKIHCIASGLVVTGLGAIFFAVPHFQTSDYAPLNVTKSFFTNLGLCPITPGPPAPCLIKSVESTHMGMFVFGQILIGAGLAPLYSLAPSYIDENTRPKSMPFAMTLWYVLLALGPLSGLSGGGTFQAYIYIDIKQPKLVYPMDNKDPRWLGAWWLGYLVSGLLTMWFAVIVAGFPPYLPGSRNTRDEHILKGNIEANDDNITMSPVGLLYSTITLFKNKTFLFNTLANLCIVFFMYAIGPFMVQVVILKYGADPLSIAMPVTFASFFGIIAGVVGGGLLTYRITLKKLVKGAAFLCLILQTVAILVPLLFVLPGCNESNIAGVTKEYPAIGGRAMPTMGEKGSSEITSTCNAQCNCSTFASQPVCGSNNVAYFDPCHAGCKVRIDDTDDYTNCTCVPPGPGQKYGTAKKGFCDRGCASWKLFVFLLFVAVALFTANIVPSKVVILRCVKDNQRSYGLAVQQFLFILFGFIPTHLVKYIIDRDCNIWQTDSCGRKGICWDYQTNSMSKSMTIFGLVISTLATVFFFLSWYLHNERGKKSDRLLSEMVAQPEDVSDDQVTPM